MTTGGWCRCGRRARTVRLRVLLARLDAGAPMPDGDAVAVEDERAGGVAARPPSVQRVGDGERDGENLPRQRLRSCGREPLTPVANHAARLDIERRIANGHPRLVAQPLDKTHQTVDVREVTAQAERHAEGSRALPAATLGVTDVPPELRFFTDLSTAPEAAGSARGRGQSELVAPWCESAWNIDLSVSNSLSGRHWELDQVLSVGDLTDIVQLGTGHHVSVGEGQRRVALQRRVAAYLVGGGQTPSATQRCLNPGFSERIGNSRRTGL